MTARFVVAGVGPIMRMFPAVVPLVVLAGCVATEPTSQPVPQARPAPPPPPPPAPVAQGWRDWPLTQGAWVYRVDERGSSAMFGRAGVEADLILRCDFATRTIILSWPGAVTGGGLAATITTSNGSASYSGSAGAATGRIGLTFAPRDPFLDKLAFSRGRFVVASTGAGTGPVPQAGKLVIPAWPEPARAIEDCRK